MSSPRSAPPPAPPYPRALHADVESQSLKDVFAALLLLRLFNALTLSTFFQPDEYFQSLEPAWALVFPTASRATGAWITWEWIHQLRSSLHPLLIAGVYAPLRLLSPLLPTAVLASGLVTAPKVLGAVIAASGEYATWRLARKTFGSQSDEATAVVLSLALSPWQWFVSTRSLTNSLETTLTAFALFMWPWEILAAGPERGKASKRFKYAIILASTASLLRPTNTLIWIVLVLFTLPRMTQTELLSFTRDASIYGSAILLITQLLDRLFYGVWTFPPLKFLEYNLTQNLAVFYGVNRPDYYLTEGLPLLLTTLLPFAAHGLYTSLLSSPPPSTKSNKDAPTPLGPSTLTALATTSLSLLAALSLISHKEVRFIHPLLPPLTLLSARPLVRFLRHRTPSKTALLALAIFVNLSLAFYAGHIHQRGPIALVTQVRARHEHMTRGAGQLVRTNSDLPFMFSRWEAAAAGTASLDAAAPHNGTLTLGFLMPCHSTPWRSHLVHPGVLAWTLTCEPPVGLSGVERERYVDEADMFYKDPVGWLGENMRHGFEAAQHREVEVEGHGHTENVEGTEDQKRAWPMLLATFGQLERNAGVAQVLAATGYEVCWRAFSSHFHDDWRRAGDVLLWCAPGVDELTRPVSRHERT